jgi:tRNA threonylcarbamoyl adenosine modification protein (Sua5/YciO/YrdC/YwlC family)
MTPRILAPEDDLAPFVEALAAGETVVLPTDTVYGLAAAAQLEDACTRMLSLKTRDLTKPTSILCGSLSSLEAALPGLDERSLTLARRLLPGAVTLVLPNPGGRFRWLCGPDAARIGVRVPALIPALALALEQSGPIAATSANLAGGRDPASLAELPAELVAHVAVAIDAGPIAGGVPSTVVDLTGPEPVILRPGALSEAQLRALLID